MDLNELLAWIKARLDEPLTLGAIAAQAAQTIRRTNNINIIARRINSCKTKTVVLFIN